jgi:hypothetical protein
MQTSVARVVALLISYIHAVIAVTNRLMDIGLT